MNIIDKGTAISNTPVSQPCRSGKTLPRLGSKEIRILTPGSICKQLINVYKKIAITASSSQAFTVQDWSPYGDSLQRSALVLYWGCYSSWCLHPSEHTPANPSYKCLDMCLSCIHSLVIPSQGSGTKLCWRRQLRVTLRRMTVIAKFCSRHKQLLSRLQLKRDGEPLLLSVFIFTHNTGLKGHHRWGQLPTSLLFSVL